MCLAGPRLPAAPETFHSGENSVGNIRFGEPRGENLPFQKSTRASVFPKAIDTRELVARGESLYNVYGHNPPEEVVITNDM